MSHNCIPPDKMSGGYYGFDVFMPRPPPPRSERTLPCPEHKAASPCARGPCA